MLERLIFIEVDAVDELDEVGQCRQCLQRRVEEASVAVVDDGLASLGCF